MRGYLPQTNPGFRRLIRKALWRVSAYYGVALLTGFMFFVLGSVFLGILLVQLPRWPRGGHFLIAVSALLFTAAYQLSVSLWPRSRRGRPIGVEIKFGEHERLMNLLLELARKAGQKVPAEIFLTNEVNASAGRYGTRLGLGGTRYILLGMPLLRNLSEIELKAVLAHEYGHFLRTQSFFAGWIYRLRGEGDRVRAHFNDRDMVYHRRAFERYEAKFVPLALDISRHQEKWADAFAVEQASPGALANALKKIRVLDEVSRNLWRHRLWPTLRLGMRPPLTLAWAWAVGPKGYLANALERTKSSLDEEDEQGTHPTLKKRLETMGCDASFELAWSENSLGIFNKAEEFDAKLEELEFNGLAPAPALSWIGFEAALEQVTRRRCAPYAAWLEGKTVRDLLGSNDDLRSLSRAVAWQEEHREQPLDAHWSWVRFSVSNRLAGSHRASLAENGWQVSRREQDDVYLVSRGDETWAPVERWWEWLESDDAPTRLRAAEALGRLDDPLMPLLSLDERTLPMPDPDPDERHSNRSRLLLMRKKMDRIRRPFAPWARAKVLADRIKDLQELEPEWRRVVEGLHRDQDLLWRKGKVLWGHVFRFHSNLAKPEQGNGFASILYSHDPEFEGNQAALRDISVHLERLAEAPEAPLAADLEAWWKFLRDPKQYRVGAKVPRSLTWNREVYFSDTFMNAWSLHLGYLAKYWLPILVMPGDPGSVRPLPSEAWSEWMQEEWVTQYHQDLEVWQKDAELAAKPEPGPRN